MTPQGQIVIVYNFGASAGDGASPTGGLVQGADGNFYGTTLGGGTGNSGTVFKVTPQGQEVVLYSFLNDGSTVYPSSLVQGADGNFYGTTGEGGVGPMAGNGTVYSVTPQGQYTLLHDFGGGLDGADPEEGLVQGTDGALYGTAFLGGFSDLGTIFRFHVSQLPYLKSATAVAGTVGLPLSYPVYAANITFSYSATGLPPGLSINPVTGLVSGTPTTPGIYPAAITLTNAQGTSTATVTFTIVPLPVPSITSLPVASGSLGNSFTYTATANNNTTSFAATGLSGTGLTLTPSSGVITGTATATGTFPVTPDRHQRHRNQRAIQPHAQPFCHAAHAAQQYTVLYNFTGGNDGATPQAIIQGFDGTFYGVTSGAGANSQGTLFNMTAAGSTSTLTAFNSGGPGAPDGILQGADANFYVSETTPGSGVSNAGVLIGQVTPQGGASSFSGLSDTGTSTPQSPLIQGLDGNFYGVSNDGGTSAAGCIYKVTPGGAVSILHSFSDNTVANDGEMPQSGLVEGQQCQLLTGRPRPVATATASSTS